jgi:hypothetical protein
MSIFLIDMAVCGCGHAANNNVEGIDALKSSIESTNKNVDSLTTNVNKVIQNFESCRQDIEKLKKQKNEEVDQVRNIAYLAIVLSIASILISLLIKKNVRDISGRVQTLDDEVAKKLKDVSKPEIKTRPSTTSSYAPPLEKRVAELEDVVSAIKKRMADDSSEKKVEQHSAPVNNQNQGRNIGATGSVVRYFGTPVDNGNLGYFKKIFVSGDSETRFKVILKNNIACFAPMELTQLKSFDYFDRCVECRGVSKNDAKHMDVVSPGEAVEENGKWVIKKKAVVSLS